MELRLEGCNLFEKIVRQFLAGDFRQAGNVVNRLFRIKLGALAARPIKNVDHMGAHIQQTKFKDCKKPDGSGSDNQDVRINHFTHLMSSAAYGALVLMGQWGSGWRT